MNSKFIPATCNTTTDGRTTGGNSSERMPVWLGRTLIIGGIGYILQTFINRAGVKSSFTDILIIPATIGEFWIIGYLLIYGIRPAINNEKQ